MSNLREIWVRMGLVQRVLLLAILAACIGATVMLVGWAREPAMALLYADLAPEEASRIVEKIRESGTPLELRAGGTAVYVPTDKVYSVRLEMAGLGMPAGDQRGYRLLDEEKLGTSPFTQRLNYRRALEGEIAKSIQVLDGVQAARVHIVRPESSLFGGQEKASSATVVLRLKPGWRMSPRNIAAVLHLVAGGVEGLKPEGVVVVDGSGTLLSSSSSDGVARGVSTFIDFKTQHEEYLSHKVEDMLTLVLGPNRATVRVSCTIDNTSTTSTSEVFDPQAKVPLKEETKTKSGPGAAAGADAAAAPAGAPTKEETSMIDYIVGRTVKQETVVPGKVTSISVAAFVDLSAPVVPPPAAGAEAPKTPPPAVTLKVTDVETIIRSALGLKETDTIKVVDTPFRAALAPEAAGTEETAGEGRTFYLDMAKNLSMGVLVLGALVALKLVSGGKKRGAAPAAALPAGAGAAGALPPGGSLAGSLTSGAVDPALLRSRITAALQENPEEVKRLFLAWAEGNQGGA
ncbi:MAG: flagellar basal-body MS-ring/collar protein FliF [Planctomycetota bacterium]|nr:flagellar basal-body MS-ring/collar protein FliF [Planctomycetota bacterium]